MPSKNVRRSSAQIDSPMPLTGVTMTLDLPPGCAAYDYYGNAVDSPTAELKLPLDERGIFLRGDPKQPGSFAALLDALATVRNRRASNRWKPSPTT